MNSEIPLAVQKATQALNFFADRASSGSPNKVINKLKALKLLFFADRFHVRTYARLVSDCRYFAMKNGLVASEAKHVAEDGGRLPFEFKRYSTKFIRKKNLHDYESVHDLDRAILSKSDIDALNFAWETFGHYTQFQLVEISHHYPEWKSHKNYLSNSKRRIEIDYADFFKDADRGYNPCGVIKEEDRLFICDSFLVSKAF